jgi:two-component system, NarL family, nitrate/nitrite response regulator NarL
MFLRGVDGDVFLVTLGQSLVRPLRRCHGRAGEYPEVVCLFTVGIIERNSECQERQMTLTVLIGQGGLSLACLRRIFDRTNFCVIACGSSIEELSLSPLLAKQPILLVIDARHQAQGTFTQVNYLKKEYPAARIAVLIDSNCQTDIVWLFRAGAHACFQTGATSPAALLKSLELVMLGETLLPSGFLSWILRGEEPPAAPAADGKPRRLLPEEENILRYLVEGQSNRVIANRLGIALGTANVHVKAVLRKVGAQNRTQAAIWATTNVLSKFTPRHSRLRTGG